LKLKNEAFMAKMMVFTAFSKQEVCQLSGPPPNFGNFLAFFARFFPVGVRSPFLCALSFVRRKPLIVKTGPRIAPHGCTGYSKSIPPAERNPPLCGATCVQWIIIRAAAFYGSLAEFCARLKEFCAPLKEFCTPFKEFCAPLKEFCTRLKEFCTRLKEFCAPLKEFCTRLKEFCAPLKEFCTRLKEFCT
jgi:hypothetical protein